MDQPQNQQHWEDDSPLDELQSLKRSEQHYRTVFREASEVMLVADISGGIIAANRAAVRATGCPEENLRTMKLFDLFSPEQFDRLRRDFDDVVGGAETSPAEYELVRKGGDNVLVEIQLRGLREESKPVGVHVIARDASLKKSAEDALKCARENLERFANCLPDAVLIESAEHVMQFSNEAGRSRFGEVKGKQCHEVLGLDQLSPICAVEEIIAKRRNTYRRTYAHGDDLWEIRGIPLLNADGSTSVLEIIRDITEVADVHDDETLAEKLATLGRVVTEMAHEIKNPLSAVTTFAQLLSEKHDDEEFRRVFSRTAVQAARRIDYLMEELVNFAKPLKPVLERVDLHEILEQALTKLRGQFTEKEIRVTRDFSAEPMIMSLDREHIKRLLIVLLSNSADAVEQGGNVTIFARFASDLERDREKEIELAVSDDGVGISPENLPRVFEPFYTTSSDRLGLGLSIAKRIVEAHNGTITVRSRPGEGSTFVVRLRSSKRDKNSKPLDTLDF